MPKTCVAIGCNNSYAEGVCLHKFPANIQLRKQWTAAVVKTRQDWKGPTDYSVLCSLHFKRECYEPSSLLQLGLGLQPRRLVLQDTAVPSLFPKKEHITSGSLEWARGSVHIPESSAGPSNDRKAVLKRKRAQVRIFAIAYPS
jgi:hypothetical protein